MSDDSNAMKVVSWGLLLLAVAALLWVGVSIGRGLQYDTDTSHRIEYDHEEAQ